MKILHTTLSQDNSRLLDEINNSANKLNNLLTQDEFFTEVQTRLCNISLLLEDEKQNLSDANSRLRALKYSIYSNEYTYMASQFHSPIDRIRLTKTNRAMYKEIVEIEEDLPEIEARIENLDSCWQVYKDTLAELAEKPETAELISKFNSEANRYNQMVKTFNITARATLPTTIEVLGSKSKFDQYTAQEQEENEV